MCLTACFEQDDFDTNKISLDDLRPGFSLPLIHDTLSLTGHEYLPLDGSTNVFSFNMDEMNFPAATEWFTLSAQSSPFSGSYTTPNSGPVEIATTLTSKVPITLPRADQRLDRAEFTSITLQVDMGSTPTQGFSEVQVWSPQITVSNAPYTYTATGNAATAPVHYIVLRECTLLPDNGEIDLYLYIKESVPGDGSTKTLQATVSLVDPEHKLLVGYFGQVSQTRQDSIAITYFNHLDITGGTVEFTMLEMAVNIQNSIGIPLRMHIDRATVHYADGTTSAVNNLGTIDILSPSYLNPYEIVVSNKDTLHSTLLAQKLRLDAKKIVFTYTLQANVGGPVDAGGYPVTNCLTYMSTVKTKGTQVRIPLRMSVQELVFTDTLDLDLSAAMSLEELRLRTIVENNMPAHLKLQLTLLEKDTQAKLHSIFEEPLAVAAPVIVDEMATEPVVVLEDVDILPEVIDDLKRSGRAMVTISLSTEGAEHVQFLSSNNIVLKIGGIASFQYDEVFK
jgi:hypothetical protein